MGRPTNRRITEAVALIALLASCTSGLPTPTQTSPSSSPTPTPSSTVPDPTTTPPTTPAAPSTSASATPTTAKPPPPKPKPKPKPPLAALSRGGQHILPAYRVVAYYGAPGGDELGVLGRGTPDQAAAAVARQAAKYARFGRRIQPAMELIATVAQGGPGHDGLYSKPIAPSDIARYLAAAHRHKLLLVLDFQPGRGEFLPQVHRRPAGLEVVLHADGLATPAKKITVYHDLRFPCPPFHAGFKLFYRADTGLMTPAQVMALRPQPEIVTYQ